MLHNKKSESSRFPYSTGWLFVVPLWNIKVLACLYQCNKQKSNNNSDVQQAVMTFCLSSLVR